MNSAEELDRFERQLGELVIKYEQYFLGIEKREPLQMFGEVERHALRLASSTIVNSLQRFRCSSLVARFTTYRQHWSRVVRLIDEGKYQRNRCHGSAAAQKDPASPVTRSEPENSAGSVISDLYRQLMSARTACNLPTEGITSESIRSAVEMNRPLIMERYNCRGVEFRVVIEDGKPKIKARPVS